MHRLRKPPILSPQQSPASPPPMMRPPPGADTWRRGYKHPLHNTWTLWYLDKNRNKDWQECLSQVGTFNTVEDFWCLFNYVRPASVLKPGCDYFLFKAGIQPMWEDPANNEGGRWMINLDRKLLVNQYWLEVCMCMVGECFYGCNELICGATINIRNKGFKICLWLSNSANDNGEVIHIGLKLRELLGFPHNQVIVYQKHRDKNGNGSPKYTYYV